MVGSQFRQREVQYLARQFGGAHVVPLRIGIVIGAIGLGEFLGDLCFLLC